MLLFSQPARGIRTVIPVTLSLFLLLNAFCSTGAVTQDRDEKISEIIEEVIRLRANGEYKRAIELLNRVIREYSTSEEVLRYLYNHLVFTYQKMGQPEAAIAKARKALERFPDLRVETPDIPPSINDIYNDLRKEMFASLEISEPAACHVFLIQDSVEVYKGKTPLELPLVRTGKYTLQVTKSGYHDYIKPIKLAPNEKYSRDIPLKRDRGMKWWLFRTVPVVVAGALAAVLLWPEGSETDQPQPLPEPPAPPTQ